MSANGSATCSTESLSGATSSSSNAKAKRWPRFVPIERLEQMRRFARRQALDFMEEQAGPLTEREASDLALEAQRFARRRVRKPRRGKK